MVEPGILATGNEPSQLLYPAFNSSPDTHPANIGMVRNKGTVMTSTPDKVSECMSDTAMRLMLMAGRRLAGKTLGIIGFGRVGREMARRAYSGFGMKIVVHDHCVVSDEDLGQLNAEQVDDIDHLLVQSDFVSLHCSAHAGAFHLMDALRLNRMKPDAYLINTAGADLVDEEALADALWYDTIAGAGLGGIAAVCDRLRGCENFILLQPPHAGGARVCNSV